MNIAILIPSLGAGGAERAASVIGDNLINEGHNVYYFLFVSSERRFYKVRGEVINSHIFSPFSCEKTIDCIREIIYARAELIRLKRKYKIDAAISFMEEWNYLNALSKDGRKTLVSVRTVLTERKEGKGMLYERFWQKLILSRADKIVAVSDYVRNDICNNCGIKRKKVVSIPNISQKREIISDKKWEYGRKTIVTVGRLEQIKQPDRVIRAFSYALKKVEDAKLCMVGEGRLKNSLVDLCNELGISDSVVFVGSTNDVSYYLKYARAFVMTSKLEGFPNAMVEAMAYGVPVITTDSPGGCGEIVGKEKSSDDIQYCRYGILTPYIIGDIKRNEALEKEEQLLGEAMVGILNDDDMYSRYSKASIQRADIYSLKNVMALWDKELITGK